MAGSKKSAAELAREKLKLPLGRRPVIETVFSVAQVVERWNAGGYETEAIGYFAPPPPHRWDEEQDMGPEFFPAAGISAKLILEWSISPGQEKPGAAFYSTTYKVTIEALDVPVEPVRDPITLEVTGAQRVDRQNGGLMAPRGRRL